MLKATLVEFFERELVKLKEEIGSYADERDLWIQQGAISNSAGNLCLHLIGNLNHFIGAVLGQTGYLRQRDLEFSRKNVPRAEMMSEIDQTIAMVIKTLEALPESDFYATYPIEKHGKIVSTDYMLVHLLTHLNYHIGQINYHRRLLS